MVDIIRGKQRNYIPDQSESIGKSQIAQTLKDFSETVSSVGGIVTKLEATKEKRAKEESDKAASDLKAHEKEMQAALKEIRYRRGEGITSEEGEKEVRETIGALAKKYRPQYDNERIGIAYDKAADNYISSLVDSNYLYATETKIDRLQAEKREQDRLAKEQAKSKAQTASKISDMYSNYAGELGKTGDINALNSVLSDLDKDMGKSMKEMPTFAQDRAKDVAREAAVRNYALNALKSGDEQIAKEWDLALTDNEQFAKTVPQAYIQPHLVKAKEDTTQNLQRQRAMLVNQAATTEEKSKENKELKKQIKEIDKKIEDLTENNVIEVDGEKKDFDEVVTDQLRESLKQTLEPIAVQQLGEEALVTRQEKIQEQKENAALAAADPLNPAFKLDLIRLAKQEELDGPQMSYIGDEKPKGFWKQFADNVMGYADNMSHVSQLAYTDVNVQGDANAMVKQLTYEQLESPTGDPTDFEYKCFKTLHDISKLEMSEEDRRNAQNAISKLMLSQDSDVRELRALLESGEVGIIPSKDKLGWEIVAKMRGYEQGTVQGYLAKEAYVLDAFDKRMYHAQQKYQTLAVNMWANGATYDQIMNERNKIFKDEVDGFYREFHLTNLAELDEKVKNHEPAFAKFNGITYEYKGRGPDQRPIWYDHAVLNTNRDFARFFESKPMKDPNKKSE